MAARVRRHKVTLATVSSFTRVRRRRPPFTLALVGLVVLLTGLTGAIIGGDAWREQRARSRALLDAAMTQAARLTAAHADRVLEDAAATARLGAELVQQGHLEPEDDSCELEGFLLAVLGVRDTVMVYRLLSIIDEAGRPGAEARMTHLDAVD